MKIIRICPPTGGAMRFFDEEGNSLQTPKNGTNGTITAEEAGVKVSVIERACTCDNERKTYGTFKEVTVVEFPSGLKHFL